MLHRAVHDRPHALLDHLVLERNSHEPRETLATLLSFTIDQVIVPVIACRTPATRPVVSTRQVLHRARESWNDRPIGVGHLLLLARRTLRVHVEDHGVLIVDRNPRIRRHVALEAIARVANPERQDEVGEAVMVKPLHCRAGCRIHGPVRHLADADFRRLVLDEIGVRIIRIHAVRINAAGVQEGQVRRIDVAFQRLQPVAVSLEESDVPVVGFLERGFYLRQRRRGRLLLAHVDIDKTALLRRAIGDGLGACRILVLVRQVRLIETIAVNVEFPAVIDAADAVLLVTPEEQRCTPVRAPMVHDADPAGCVAECDQLLVEQLQANRDAILHQLGRTARGYPKLPHEVAHGSSAPNAHKRFILGGSDHLILRRIELTAAGAHSVSRETECAPAS